MRHWSIGQRPQWGGSHKCVICCLVWISLGKTRSMRRNVIFSTIWLSPRLTEPQVNKDCTKMAKAVRGMNGLDNCSKQLIQQV